MQKYYIVLFTTFALDVSHYVLHIVLTVQASLKNKICKLMENALIFMDITTCKSSTNEVKVFGVLFLGVVMVAILFKLNFILFRKPYAVLNNMLKIYL